MVTAQDLAVFLNTTLEAHPEIEGLFDEATALVDDYVRDAEVPEAVLDKAYLRVGRHLYKLDESQTGSVRTQLSTEGTAIAQARLARDPLTLVYPILRRWVGYW
jgi:hypothetical protein